MRKLLVITISWFFCYNGFANPRIIVKLKPDYVSMQQGTGIPVSERALRLIQMQPFSNLQLQKLSQKAGTSFIDIKANAIGARVLELSTNVNPAQLAQILKQLNSMPDVAYAEKDVTFYPTVNQPNIYQWDMYTQTTSIPETIVPFYGDSFYNGSNFVTSSGSGITVAVLDTGYVPHPNLLNNLQSLIDGSESYGYTFITDCRRAGTCPFSTPDDQALINPYPNGLDLGDWMTLAEYDSASSSWQEHCQYEDGQPVIKSSSWHGTHVTGTIVGEGPADPEVIGSGVLGGAYSAKVLPVRVLGKCGGSIADIVDGMLWAAGLHPDIPNFHPVKVLNMSLGGYGSCPQIYQEAIDLLTLAGVSIVVSAGNDAQNVNTTMPANCRNVISVGALSPTQKLAIYSNWGNVTISASGGEEFADYTTTYPSKAIFSTIYGSSEGYGDAAVGCSGNGCFTYGWNQGTSMAAPHVAAAIADMLAINPALTPAEITAILQASASSFDNCSEFGCVSGGRLNTAGVLDYINESINLLTPNPVQLTDFSLGSSSVTLTNRNIQPVMISSLSVIGARSTNFVIAASSSCVSGVLLNQGQNCSVTIITHDMKASYDYFARLVVKNESNEIVTDVPLAYSMPAAALSTSGGGCSTGGSGDDSSLLLLTILACIYYRLRRKL